MPTTSTPPDPAVFSPKQAAEFMSVNIKTIHALLARGLPHQRFGRVIRITRSDLLAFGRVKN